MKVPSSLPLRTDTLEGLAEGTREMYRRTANALNNPDEGVTSGRPASQLTIGQTYFDTTLGKPIWWKGAVWVDATGATV